VSQTRADAPATSPTTAAGVSTLQRHITPAFRSYSGEGALEGLATELDRAGCSRAAVICGAWLLEHPQVFGRIESALGDRLVGVFTDVEEHSPIPSVRAAAQTLSRLDADAVVAVGGGSSIVTARAATILLAEGEDVRSLCTQQGPDGRLFSPKLAAPKLPIWLVPSTPITAYAKAGSALRDPASGDRLALFDPKTRAQAVFFDPEVALTAPPELTLGSALNAFSMSVESVQGSTDPLTDALALHALYVLAGALVQLAEKPHDGHLRLQLMIGALLAGQGSDFVGGGLAQALAHTAGPRSTVSNGIVETILLPHTMRYTSPATPGRLAMIASAVARTGVLGGPEDDTASRDEQAVQAVDGLFTRLGVPRRLRDVGVQRSDLSEIAQHTLGDWTLTRIPRQAGLEELLGLLKAAW
jgi:alcohol dehydrogenase class IV